MLRVNGMLSLPLVLLAAVALLRGQDAVIRVDVKLVQVDAVVRFREQAHRQPESGRLRNSQDGKRQTITNFSYIFPDPPPAVDTLVYTGQPMLPGRWPYDACEGYFHRAITCCRSS